MKARDYRYLIWSIAFALLTAPGYAGTPSTTTLSATPPAMAATQKTLEQIKAELISVWLVRLVGNDCRTRTLEIQDVTQQTEREFLLISTYGYTGDVGIPVKATVSIASEGLKLELITQANSLINAEQSASGSFIGTFKYENGAVTTVTLEKAVGLDLSSCRSSALSGRTSYIDVPVEQPSLEEIQPIINKKWHGFGDTGRRGNLSSMSSSSMEIRLLEVKVEKGVCCKAIPCSVVYDTGPSVGRERRLISGKGGHAKYSCILEKRGDVVYLHFTTGAKNELEFHRVGEKLLGINTLRHEYETTFELTETQ